MLTEILLCVAGFSFGALSSTGVFTVLVAVGLVPRFAGKTHTGKYVLLYEEMVVFGTITGCFLSVFPEYSQLGAMWQRLAPAGSLPEMLGQTGNMIFGLFSGMFVGCLALAIAEMLDSIPIFTRRISLKRGIGLVILALAIGKLAGSLFYFAARMYQTVK